MKKKKKTNKGFGFELLVAHFLVDSECRLEGWEVVCFTQSFRGLFFSI